MGLWVGFWGGPLGFGIGAPPPGRGFPRLGGIGAPDARPREGARYGLGAGRARGLGR